jgi:hypothetical protein
VLFWIPDELPGLIAQYGMRFILFIVKGLKLISARISTYATNPAAKYDYSNLE